LPIIVQAPASHRAIDEQCARQIADGANVDSTRHVGDWRDGEAVVSGLFLEIVSPAPDGSVGAPGARVATPCGDLHHAGQAGDLDRIGKEARLQGIGLALHIDNLPFGVASPTPHRPAPAPSARMSSAGADFFDVRQVDNLIGSFRILSMGTGNEAVLVQEFPRTEVETDAVSSLAIADGAPATNGAVGHPRTSVSVSDGHLGGHGCG
jgi:hypothetical protein